MSGNPKLNENDLLTLLAASASDDACPLSKVDFCGCGLVSPLAEDVVDALVWKLHHRTPLTKLRLSCQKLSEKDAAGLRGAWSSRWLRQSSVVIGRETVTCSVNDG